jgi:transcriptional regulator MraZ
MSLTGTYQRAIDDKQRIAVPKPLRDGFGEEAKEAFYLAPGNEGCLNLYTKTGFDQLAAKLAQIPSGHANVRNYMRLLHSLAERVVLDKQSRVRIPERLAERAGLSHAVVLIGVYDHVEIWDQERWDSFLSQNESQFDELTERALDGAVPEGLAI